MLILDKALPTGACTQPGCPERLLTAVDHGESRTSHSPSHPHLNHVPAMAGGNGPDGVHAFYRDHLVGKFFPKDTTFTSVSRTIGHNTLVEEMIIAFTHTTQLDFMLPGVEPTGKRIEAAFVVIIGFDGGRISHEHIYWDQASVLVQIGLLDPKGLPVRGAQSARSVLDPSLLAHKK